MSSRCIAERTQKTCQGRVWYVVKNSRNWKTHIHLSMVHGCFCPMVRIWSMLLDYIGLLPNRIRMNPGRSGMRAMKHWHVQREEAGLLCSGASSCTRFRSKVSHVVRERKDQNGSEWYCSCWMYFVSTTWCLFARFCAVIESAVGSPVYAVASNNSCNWQRWPLGSEVNSSGSREMSCRFNPFRNIDRCTWGIISYLRYLKIMRSGLEQVATCIQQIRRQRCEKRHGLSWKNLVISPFCLPSECAFANARTSMGCVIMDPQSIQLGKVLMECSGSSHFSGAP